MRKFTTVYDLLENCQNIKNSDGYKGTGNEKSK